MSEPDETIALLAMRRMKATGESFEQAVRAICLEHPHLALPGEGGRHHGAAGRLCWAPSAEVVLVTR